MDADPAGYSNLPAEVSSFVGRGADRAPCADLLAVSRLLRRLAVFAGGCTEDAAARVAGFGPLDAAAVPGLLSRLVDASMLQLDDRGEPRGSSTSSRPTRWLRPRCGPVHCRPRPTRGSTATQPTRWAPR